MGSGHGKFTIYYFDGDSYEVYTNDRNVGIPELRCVIV